MTPYMTLPKEFSLPESPGAGIIVAHNLRVITGITIVHIDDHIVRTRTIGRDAIIPGHPLTRMYDLQSSLQAMAITFEQAQWWCSHHGLTVKQLLEQEAITDENRKQISTILELGAHALEK